MVYISAEKSADGIAEVVYSSKDGHTKITFDALDRLAGLVVHVPNEYEQLVGYVGYEKNLPNRYMTVRNLKFRLMNYCLPVPLSHNMLWLRGTGRRSGP